MNMVKTVFLMGLLLALMIFIGHLYGGRDGATMAFVFAMVINLGSFWFSDKIVLGMYGAKPLDRRDAGWLQESAARLAAEAGIPAPRLFLIESDQPNAFATGRSPAHGAVAVTSGLLRLMSRDEVEGVLAHEIAHISHRDTLIATLAAAFAGAIMYLASMARWAAIFGGGRSGDRGRGGLELLFVMLVAPLAASLIQLAISRSREYAADESAARYAGSSLGLARALEKLGYAAERIPANAAPATAHLFIVNPLSGGGLVSLFSTHPPIRERVRRLYAQAGIAA
jgi:heat shock protein HtpX